MPWPRRSPAPPNTSSTARAISPASSSRKRSTLSSPTRSESQRNLSRNGKLLGLCIFSPRPSCCAHRSDDTDARWGYGQAKLRGRVFRVQRRSQTDRSPAWPRIESTDSSADRPPLTGPQHINIRWKAQGLRFPRPEAQGSRNGSSTDGHDRSLVFLSPFAISRPTPLVPEQQRRMGPSTFPGCQSVDGAILSSADAANKVEKTIETAQDVT